MSSFSASEFHVLFSLSMDRGYGALRHLQDEGFIKKIARGRYVVTGGSGENLGLSFYIGTRLVEPCYVGFWSALNFYGWTEQAPRTVFIANTRVSGRRRVEAGSFRLVRMKPRHFFGYTVERQGPVEFPIADKQKAIVDSLWMPSCSGGTGEVNKALGAAVNELSKETLVEYALRMDSKSLCSRLGYLLERMNFDSSDLRGSGSAIYVKLDPAGPRRGRYDAKWRIVDNLGGLT